ncbi:bifunctional adenosylcobinamide kinase/adenosylcobinamide-phosphate guanylyltransferase [uncultured Enterovirga sp.]|uniref:bifunctional adenosylcobinamide kinase/adenosylcobinamide-phosphate guanylyltransferase n=1 Tax=uncultured Enterovirga sp. TaxID=2026352 RepID=UPI0035CB33D8
MTALPTTLVLGGARSGKSAFAERLVLESGLTPVYVATAEAGDGEMSERILHHRERRGEGWRAVEEPLDLVGLLRAEALICPPPCGEGRAEAKLRAGVGVDQEAQPRVPPAPPPPGSASGRVHRPRKGEGSPAILVDCLTLWLSNLFFAERDLDRETAALCEFLAASDLPVVFVSNEIGMGLVPDTPLGRRFRDAQGRLNQAVAAAVPRVVFVAAGLPLWLKPPNGAG